MTPVITPPTVWEKAEDLAAAIEKTAKSMLPKISQSTLSIVESEIESGVFIMFPQIAPIAGEIKPFLADISVLIQLVNQIQLLKSVPVTPAA